MDTRKRRDPHQQSVCTLVTDHWAIPERQPLYIFFTTWGFLVLMAAMTMFSLSLIRTDEVLIFYASLTGALTLILIFMTHENLSHLRLDAIETQISLQSHGCSTELRISISNRAEVQRLNCLLDVSFSSGQSLSSTPFDLKPHAVSTVCLSLHPQDFSEKSNWPIHLQVTRIRLHSTYPSGLIRSWNSKKIAADFHIPPAAARSGNALEERRESVKQHAEIGLATYRGGPLTRIDWKRFSAKGDLYVRQEDEAENARHDAHALPLSDTLNRVEILWERQRDRDGQLFLQAWKQAALATQESASWRCLDAHGTCIAESVPESSEQAEGVKNLLEAGHARAREVEHQSL